MKIRFIFIGMLGGLTAPFADIIKSESEFAGAQAVATGFTLHSISGAVYSFPALLAENNSKSVEIELKHLSSTSTIRGESFIYASIINASSAFSIRNMFSLRDDTPGEVRVTAITLTQAQKEKILSGVNLSYINIRGAIAGNEAKIYDGNGFSIDLDLIFRKGFFSTGLNASNLGYIFFNDFDRITLEAVYRLTACLTTKNVAVGLGKKIYGGKNLTLAGVEFMSPYLNLMYGSIENMKTYGFEIKIKSLSITYSYIDEPGKLFTLFKYVY